MPAIQVLTGEIQGTETIPRHTVQALCRRLGLREAVPHSICPELNPKKQTTLVLNFGRVWQLTNSAHASRQDFYADFVSNEDMDLWERKQGR